MKQPSYRDHDYAFGQVMLTLRTGLGLTQTALADTLGVSRRAVGDWEAGRAYPKPEHLKHFITLAVQQGVFVPQSAADEIRALWKAARQKILLDEAWLASLLPVAAPPPSTIEHHPRDSRSYGFPFQPTTFVGRSSELAEITRILSDPACRLLTLLGPGGVGKTRLALETAAAHTAAYADGAAFVALASVASPNQIVSAIGDTLNLSLGSEIDPTAHLLAYLGDRHFLLVLDNFEHLLEGAALVNAILERAPRVTILTTSRERLSLHAEWLFDVQGLSYPSRESPSLETVSDYSAVQLFVQRVTQVQPSFALTETALTTIARICQRVVGMPLAIELAAASVRRLSLAEIDRQIRSNLDTLATTLRDMPARHRSLRAAFDHSWNLMTESEQAPFTRLAVFRGGFTVDAASQVASASLPTLQALVDKSLVRSAASAEPRFFMLEPIRDYALFKLNVEEAEALRRTHARYYLSLAEAAAAQWDTPKVNAAIEQLDRELDNMRAALQWIVSEGGDAIIGLQFGGALWRYWRGSGAINEGRAWLGDLLALNDDPADAAAISARLRAVQGAAWLASDQHDFSLAAQLFEQGRMLRRALGEAETETHLLLNGARQARAAGQYQQAVRLLEEALAQQRAQGDRGSSGSAGMGLSLYELALVLREQGDYVRAAALYHRCMEFHQDIGDREGQMSALLGLGDVARDQGDAEGVRKYSEPSLVFFRELNIHWAIGFAVNNLAQAAYFDGELTNAYALVSESIALFRGLKDDSGLAEVLVTLGTILLAQGDVRGAYDALTESIRLAWVTGPRLLIAAALEGLGCVLSAANQPDDAARVFGAAALMRQQMRAPMRPADQPIYDRALTRARAVLGDDAFAAAWSAGQHLPLDQIIIDLVDIG